MVAKTTRFKNEGGTKNTIMKVFAILCIAASGLSIYKYIDDMDSNYNEKNIGNFSLYYDRKFCE